jgi:hypothetical protein
MGGFSLAKKRLTEIKKVLGDRYGTQLPDDDAGRDDLRIFLEHCSGTSNFAKTARNFCSLWAPWLSEQELEDLLREVHATARPYYTADEVARRLNVTYVERTRLGLTTIGSVDVDASERRERAKQRKRARERARRAARIKAAHNSEMNGSTYPAQQSFRASAVFYTLRDFPDGATVAEIAQCQKTSCCKLVWTSKENVWPNRKTLHKAVNRAVNELAFQAKVEVTYRDIGRGLKERVIRRVP